MRFAHSLAYELGYASPRRMLTEMDGLERLHWAAWFALKEEERKDAALDARGKANLSRAVGG